MTGSGDVGREAFYVQHALAAGTVANAAFQVVSVGGAPLAAWTDDRMEANAENLVADLSPGTRVIVTIRAPADSRIAFISHAVERACIGHCFSYANYEPSSGEFRVRVRKGSPVVSSSTDDAEDMASGEYEVDETDLPLKQIYQCDDKDLTRLCIRDLEAGETNGRMGYQPGTR